METKLKDKLIEDVSKETGLSESIVRSVVNHQFVSIKLMVSLNETGELHIPFFGRLESNAGRVKYISKRIEKEKQLKEKDEGRDRSVDRS